MPARAAVFAAAATLAHAPAAVAQTQAVQEVMVTAPRRVDLPLLTEPVSETPQTITLITQQVIELGGQADLRDVLRLDPSVSQHADEDNAQGTNVQIRGFSARNDLYRDGQLDLGRYYRDPFDLQTVEVLTGPSSVLFGRGSTGGAVNAVSKSASLTPLLAGAVSAGSEGLARFSADFDAPLSASSALRVNAVAHTSGTAGRDQVRTRRMGVSPVLGFGLGGPTEVTLGFMHQSQFDRPDYGVPWIDIGTPGGVSRPAAVRWANYYGFEDDYSRVRADVGTLRIKHALASGWTFTDQVRAAWYGRRFRASNPGVDGVFEAGTPLSAVTATRTMRGLQSRESFIENLAGVSGRFKLGKVTHKPVFGVQVGRQTSDPTLFSYKGVPGTNLVSPEETGLFRGTTDVKSEVRFSADTAGAYAGDTLEVGRIELVGAARIDRFAATYRSAVPTPVRLKRTDVEPSFRAAFVYKLAPAGRAYLMWGTSFDPSAENLSLSAWTADLVPLRNRTVEAGLKWDFNRTFLLSGALFRTVQENYREPSPLDPTVTTIVGTARSQGFELLAQGRINPRWLVLGGYTYLDARIVSSPNIDAGQQLQNTPRHSLRLFSAYELSTKLTLGGGLNYSSRRVPSSKPDPNGFWQEVPGYATVSALARYQVGPGLSLQLNLDNLLDKRYYDGTDDNHVNVGAGRSVRLTLAFRR